MTWDGPELVLTGARAGYATIEALHGVDLTVPRGAVTVLVGPNGAGKSTLLRILAGSLPLRAGTLRWRGEQIDRLSAYDRARRGLLLVPDERAVFASLTVRENLTVVAEAFGRTDLDPALTRFPVLAQRLAQRAGTLSGGERRMLALSRALLAAPSVLLLDELSLGLAPQVTQQLFDQVGDLARAGTTVVLADQYVDAALELADSVCELHRGAVGYAGDVAGLRRERRQPAG